MKRRSKAGMSAFLATALAAVAQVGAMPYARPEVQRVLIAGAKAEDSASGACWVRLFDGIDYRGEQLMLIGPLDVARMKESGEPWRDWDSVVVGPGAVLTTFNAPGFEQPATRVGPDRSISDLTRSTGRFDDIESVRVTCETP